MNVIFQISGGIGKCVAATAMLSSIKQQYPDSQLVIVSGYPEVFLNNPFVYRSFAFGQVQYFYQDFIENKEFVIMANDPYLATGHIKQNEHLIKTWTEMFNVPTPEKIVPQIHLTEREKTFYGQKFTSDKPILLLQTNGGAEQQGVKYSWARDIPAYTVQNIIHEFKDAYNIVHIRREDQPAYEHTTTVTDNFRSLSVLISLSRKRLFMDSFAQHVAAGLGMASTVLWIANKPEVFGYDIHDNIVSNPFTVTPELKGAYLSKFNISGDLLEFPYNNESEIFDVDAIIKSIKKQ
jgi:hypothetical protein